MDLKSHIRHSLATARRMTEGILNAFQTEDDWLFQVHPKVNHALWIVAHLGLADNLFAAKFRPASGHTPEGWEPLFWFGSQLQADRSAYPSSSEVLAYFRERRDNLLRVVDEVSDAELGQPAPPLGDPSPIAGAPCIGHLLLFGAQHETFHAGQLAVNHRALGHPPLYAP
jgi:uncharacterized damage-inducible protein DinB